MQMDELDPRNADTPHLPPPRSLDLAQAERLVRARSADAAELSFLLRNADPDLIRTALKNPQLNDLHLTALLRRPNLPEAVVRAIHRTPQGAASRRVKIALAGHPATPAPLLSEILGQLRLLELSAVIRLPGIPADHKSAAQYAILKRLPESDLGTKITLARQGSAAVLEALLCEGDSRLVDAVLANPRLVEGNLLAFLRSPTASAEAISAVARHPRWGVRPNVRLAALRNPNTPAIWFTLFLPGVASAEVRRLSDLKGLAPRQLQAVQEQLAKRENGQK